MATPFMKTRQVEGMKVLGKQGPVFWKFWFLSELWRRDGLEEVENSGLASKRDFKVNVYIRETLTYVNGIWILGRRWDTQNIDSIAYSSKDRTLGKNTLRVETKGRWMRRVVSAIWEDSKEKSDLKWKKLSLWEQCPTPWKYELWQGFKGSRPMSMCWAH